MVGKIGKMNTESNLLKFSSSLPQNGSVQKRSQSILIYKKDSLGVHVPRCPSVAHKQVAMSIKSINIFLSSSLLECKLPPWNIALVLMGGLALLFALVGSIETIIDGIYVCSLRQKGELRHSPKQSFTYAAVGSNLALCDPEMILLLS